MFWFGDLNFRLDDSKLNSAEEISRSVNSVRPSQQTANVLNVIWSQDELSSVMQKSQAFKEFFELVPMFPPTYRFLIGSSSYDLKYVFIINMYLLI